MTKVADVASTGARTKRVGVGASGDTTLLADKAAEDIILKAVVGVGGTRVLSEEGGELGEPRGKLVAIVDPLDGSSNYERGIPFYCSSIAICRGNDVSKVSFGHIRNLVTGDVYNAERGKGAFKNGKRITTSKVKELSRAVLGVDLSRTSEDRISRSAPLIAAAKRQVHFGANALELCLLAEGTIDATVDLRGKMRVTDFAAGYLIAKEAGAIVTDGQGKGLTTKVSLKERFSYVGASNGELHRKIMGFVGKIG